MDNKTLVALLTELGAARLVHREMIAGLLVRIARLTDDPGGFVREFLEEDEQESLRALAGTDPSQPGQREVQRAKEQERALLGQMIAAALQRSEEL